MSALSMPLFPCLPLSIFSSFPLWDFLFICCGLVHFCIPCLTVCICVCVSCLRANVCTQRGKCCRCVYTNIGLLVYVCAVTVHASLWDALISAHCGSAPSCPCGWSLIETNQACDGPIAVTPNPSHPRPNHLLIGPRRAPSRWHERLI